MPKTDAERREILASLNLNPDAPALEPRPIVKQPAAHIEWAPTGTDPHVMAVTDIVFDPAMVEHFADLSPRGRSEATRFLFAQYKSLGRNKDRNRLLHNRIGEFLARVHADRTQPGGFVKDKIRLANTLAEHGVTDADIAAVIALKKEGLL